MAKYSLVTNKRQIWIDLEYQLSQSENNSKNEGLSNEERLSKRAFTYFKSDLQI